MKEYRRKLPSLDGLVFFEAAARHMSFTAAAEAVLRDVAAIAL